MVDLAWISLAALLLVIVLSCTTAVNPGFASLALAWVIGIYLAPLWGRHFTIGEVMAGFPTELFLTLLGVTLLFALARGNGALDQQYIRGGVARRLAERSGIGRQAGRR